MEKRGGIRGIKGRLRNVLGVQNRIPKGQGAENERRHDETGSVAFPS